jgi:hypothetical protein
LAADFLDAVFGGAAFLRVVFFAVMR